MQDWPCRVAAKGDSRGSGPSRSIITQMLASPSVCQPASASSLNFPTAEPPGRFNPERTFAEGRPVPSAIYIEYPRITLVEVGGNARKPKLKSVIVGDLAEARNEDGTPITDKQAYLNKQIETFLKENKVKTSKLNLLVGPDGMRYRDMHLDFKDRRQIDRVLAFQVEGVLPTVAIEDLAIGYIILHEEGDGVRVLVHAADKDYVRSRIVALEENNALVDAADSHLSGTLNLGLLHPELSADQPPTLWMDFAGSTAMVAAVYDGKVYSARVFLAPYLAESDEAKKAAQVRNELQAAEARAREFAGDEDDEGATLPKAESVNIGEQEIADRIGAMTRDELQKFLTRVGIEARRTLLREHLDAAPERLVVSGLGSAGDQLAEALGAELELPDARAIDLLEPVIPTSKDGTPKIDVPDVGELSYLVGVAIKGLGRDESGINFRYGDLAPGTMFDYAKTPLAFAATLVLLVAGILCMMAFVELRRFENLISELRDTPPGIDTMFARAYGPVQDPDQRATYVKRHNRLEEFPANEIRNAHRILLEHQRELEGANTAEFNPPWPADEIKAEVLRRIAAANPSFDFALLRLNVDPATMRIEMFVSLSEDQAEREARRPRLPAEQRNLAETDRILASINAMIRDNPQWFEGEPTQSYGARNVERPNEHGSGPARRADQMNLVIRMKRPERARPSAGGS